ncbi:MAG TPA: rod-binding protein [Negativicutes bacterium]|nr:rod-binding protein [Negativicutes bacterium]
MIDSINSGNNIIDYGTIKGKTQEAKQGEFQSALDKAIGEKDGKKLKETCMDLEAVFINMMFSQMRSTVQKDELFGGGYAEDMYQDMLYEKYADEASKSGGIGIADMLYQQLSKGMNKESEENNAK